MRTGWLPNSSLLRYCYTEFLVVAIGDQVVQKAEQSNVSCTDVKQTLFANAPCKMRKKT
jgi:hypothetical protein